MRVRPLPVGMRSGPAEAAESTRRSVRETPAATGRRPRPPPDRSSAPRLSTSTSAERARIFGEPRSVSRLRDLDNDAAFAAVVVGEAVTRQPRSIAVRCFRRPPCRSAARAARSSSRSSAKVPQQLPQFARSRPRSRPLERRRRGQICQGIAVRHFISFRASWAIDMSATWQTAGLPSGRRDGRLICWR